MGYADLIANAIGTDDAATIALVEEIMRNDRSGLDGLNRPEFDALARQSFGDMLLMGEAGMIDDYCDALGVAVPARFAN